jgi:cysteine sulfinate desulfinase/cysteine desulfurase-like protein/rhodanese-related sulfurtransferase
MQEGFGNPSSTHSSGIQAKLIMDETRQLARQSLGIKHGQLVFVSGATEAIQTAVFSALLAIRENISRDAQSPRKILYGATEHKAVPESLSHWNRVLNLGLELLPIPVDQHGMHDVDFIHQNASECALLCTMAANNETGVITDLNAISTAIEKAKANSSCYWLVDSVQALGKLNVDLEALGVDYASFSGHKLYAPKGIGLLFVAQDAPFTSLFAGGGQEFGMRSGTENVAGIAALGAIFSALKQTQIFQTHEQQSHYRNQLLAALRETFPELVLNASLDNTLPTTINFSVPGLTSKEILDLFDAAGIRVSAGSACGASKAKPSYVLEAMGLDPWRCASAVRVSFGPADQAQFIEQACERIRACGLALRQSCLSTGGLEPLPADGLIQLSYANRCSWILADAKTKQCILIDPQLELSERLLQYVRCQNYSVLAIVETQNEISTTSQKLRQALTIPTDTAHSLNRKFHVCLKDGSNADAILIGDYVFATTFLPTPQQEPLYLVGHVEHGKLSAQFAFVGDHFCELYKLSSELEISSEAALLSCLDSDTLLCPAHDAQRNLLRTLAQPKQVNTRDFTLTQKQLTEFFKQHTNALLVDVREPFEHALSQYVLPKNTPIIHMPLSRLVNGIKLWMNEEPKELVFVCRSGNRSLVAAQCLRRLGFDHAWHLQGGIALWEH